MRVVLSVGLVLAVASLGLGPPVHPAFAPVDWWYDPDARAVCWDGRTDRPFQFHIDLDGVHETAATSEWGTGTGGLLVLPAVSVAGWRASVPGMDGQTAAQWGETRINPPIPHARHPQNTQFPQEWYHIFVTKLVPPTDYILGIQGSDGANVLPIDGPFWVSEDFGSTYQEFTPESAPTGRPCVEAVEIAAEIDFDPDTLNLRSQGRWATVYVELPLGFNPADIDATTIRLNGVLGPVLDPRYGFAHDPAGYLVDHDGDGVVERMAKFDRAQVLEILPPGTNPVRITGLLSDGTPFSGASDLVRVLG